MKSYCYDITDIVLLTNWTLSTPIYLKRYHKHCEYYAAVAIVFKSTSFWQAIVLILLHHVRSKALPMICVLTLSRNNVYCYVANHVQLY